MTRAMKENTPFRIAFCVLCHKYTPVLAELVHQLDAPGNGLFIHVDGKADIGAFAALGKTGRVCFVEPRTKVYWGGFGMVESTLRLFSATRDGGFRYVVLISGDTLPLYPAETIHTVLREAYARGRQFISANPSITPEEADRVRRRRFCPDKSTFARRLLRIAMKCTMRADNPFFDRLPPLKKGSQWIAITDRMRDFIFDYLAAHPEFIPAFRYSHAADELFFSYAARRLPVCRVQRELFACPCRLVAPRGTPENIVHKRLVSTVRAQVEGGGIPRFSPASSTTGWTSPATAKSCSGRELRLHGKDTMRNSC